MNKIGFIILSAAISCFFLSCHKNSDKKLGNFSIMACDSTSNTLPNYDKKVITFLDEQGNPVKDSIIKIDKNLTIYTPCRSFIYKTKFYGKDEELLANGKILVMPLCHRWKYDSTQDAVLIEHKYFSKQQEKTMAYFKKHKYPTWQWEKEAHTGIIENKKEVWTHPFRSNQYVLTEIAPFPTVKRPLKIGKAWQSSLKIGKNWGEWSHKKGQFNYKVM